MEPIGAVIGLPMPDAPATAPPAPYVRDRRRAGDWHDAVGRLTAHRLEHAGTEADRADIERDHEAEIARGPAFATVRRRSHDQTPVAITDRNDLVRILALFSQLEIEMHRRDRAWAAHERKRIRRTIARTVRPVLAALIGLARKHDQVHPSLQRIAAMAGCCPRTVTAALAVLERAGMVARHRRRKVVMTAYGRRVVQDANAYVLVLPSETPARIAARLDRGDAPTPAPRLPHRDQKASLAQLFYDQGEVGLPRGCQPVLPRPSVGDWRQRERQAMERSRL